MLKSYLENIKEDIKSGEIDVNKILSMAIEVTYVSDEENKKEKEFLSFLDRLLSSEAKADMRKLFKHYFIVFQNDFYIPEGEEEEERETREKYLDIFMSQSYIEIKNYLLNIIDEAIDKEMEKQKDIEEQTYITERVIEIFFNFRY